MGYNTTMVLVDAMQVFNETDLTQVFEEDKMAEHHTGAVSRLIEHFSEDYCTLISAEPRDPNADKLADAAIGYWEPERLIEQVEKYHMKNLTNAKINLEAAEYLLAQHNVTLPQLLSSDNFEFATNPQYIDGLCKAADCLNVLSGRENCDLSFYDLTDSSARISEHQMKSIRENPEAYALVPITYKN